MLYFLPQSFYIINLFNFFILFIHSFNLLKKMYPGISAKNDSSALEMELSLFYPVLLCYLKMQY